MKLKTLMCSYNRRKMSFVDTQRRKHGAKQCDHKPKNVSSHQHWKRQETDSP